MTVRELERSLSQVSVEAEQMASSSKDYRPKRVFSHERISPGASSSKFQPEPPTACNTQDGEAPIARSSSEMSAPAGYSCWTSHNQSEEALGYVFEFMSLPQLAKSAMVCKTFKEVIYGNRMVEHWASSYRQLAPPGWSPEKAQGTNRILSSEVCRQNAAKIYHLDVAGVWKVSGATYAANEYSYLMQLHQLRDEDEEHTHPVDFPLTYVQGHDVDASLDPDAPSDEEDENPELNMHFRISGTVDGQSIIMTQICRNNEHMQGMNWTNVCHATISLDGNHMHGMWMQQDHRQQVIQRSRATGRFEAKKILTPDQLPPRLKNRQLFPN